MKRSSEVAGLEGEACRSSSCLGAVDNSAFESHLSSCVRMTSASQYKPTWQLARGGAPMLREYSIADRVGPLPFLPEVLEITECPPGLVDTHFFKLRRTVDSRSWEDKLGAHLVAATGRNNLDFSIGF